MVYLDGDIDENDEINLNDLVYLEAYSFGTEGYEINEDKIYNTAIKNENLFHRREIPIYKSSYNCDEKIYNR